MKYYDNDTIGFEIYSTLLCHSSNKIVKAIDCVFKEHPGEDDQINAFISALNGIIIEAVETAIECIEEACADKAYAIVSKYHSLYILAGIVFSRYIIDVQELEITETDLNEEILDLCLDLERHEEEKWFVDEKRQMGFFVEKIKELVALQED